MTSISYYEARSRFSELLDQVARGKTIMITRRGRPAALLAPPPCDAKKDVKQVIEAMKTLRRGNSLGKGLSIRELIDEGRRFSDHVSITHESKHNRRIAGAESTPAGKYLCGGLANL